MSDPFADALHGERSSAKNAEAVGGSNVYNFSKSPLDHDAAAARWGAAADYARTVAAYVQKFPQIVIQDTNRLLVSETGGPGFPTKSLEAPDRAEAFDHRKEVHEYHANHLRTANTLASKFGHSVYLNPYSGQVTDPTTGEVIEDPSTDAVRWIGAAVVVVGVLWITGGLAWVGRIFR